LRPRGFRPPGGELTEATPALLRELGFEWCSPAGDEARVDGGLAYLPFDWELVDAYHLMDSFASLRAARGEPDEGNQQPLQELMRESLDELRAVAAAPTQGHYFEAALVS